MSKISSKKTWRARIEHESKTKQAHSNTVLSIVPELAARTARWRGETDTKTKKRRAKARRENITGSVEKVNQELITSGGRDVIIDLRYDGLLFDVN